MKSIIYKRAGGIFMTPESNYLSTIMNANLITDLSSFETAEDALKYVKSLYPDANVEIAKDSVSPKRQSIRLPIAYVHFIDACLTVIDKHNLYPLLLNRYKAYHLSEQEIIEMLDTLTANLQEVKNDVIEPLNELDTDTTIIMEDE